MKVVYFQNQGKRPYQEDSFFISKDRRLFAVCDGVGGKTKGKLASSTVVKCLEDNYTESEELNEIKIEKLISMAQKQLSHLASIDNNLIGMATTLALFYFGNEASFSAHIGDSRIIYIDTKNERFWASKDHSVVQELFESGILSSEEEMANHPMKNRITKAMEAYADVNKSITPTIQKFEIVKESDRFFLATDGVFEMKTNAQIVNTLSKNNLVQAIKIISDLCIEFSRDNNTCIALEI